MYEFQKQDSLQTLEQGIEEFYAINPAFKEILEIDSPNTKVFKEHDYTHVLFGLGTSIEEESLLDTYTIWGTKFKWGPIIDFYRDPDYSKFIKSLVGKYGGWWSIFKIYVSLITFKLKIFRLCMKMTKRWDYHTPENYLNKTLKEIREEFNIKLLPLDDVPVGRFLETQKN
jgi:hypothetical protein|tara:strand:- start:1692 stop:2204 length:513 start_codon:yes stop_codon:yes gene_type:complete